MDPIPGGGSLTELRVVQPMLMFDARAGRWLAHVTLDAEGLTIANGELGPGLAGEGYMDRRHPHTYVHEAMVVGADVLGARDGRATLTLAAGTGFVPFGTDDPMSRPPLRYPVNHHLAQVLERAVALVGLGVGRVLAEASVFNGDEPERPQQWPAWDRFGDSWSARVTVAPLAGLEAQVSTAPVRSPEHRGGAGLDTRKWSASARWARASRGGATYGLIEWARSAESGAFTFTSVLAEGEVRRGRQRMYARIERTERPEEMRTADPFRSVRPHLDNTVLGITRWSVLTAGTARRFATGWRGVVAEPLVEGSLGRVVETTGSIFDPAAFYGRDTFWTLTVAVRIAGGMDGHRMGRYGVLPRTGPAAPPHVH